MISQKDLGQLAAVLRAVRRRCSGWPPSGPPTWSSAGCCSRSARCSPTASSPTCRTASTSGSTRGRTRRATASRSSRRSSRSRPAAVTGTGLNLGSPSRIPLAETDFIFAAIGEELGLVGASAVLHRVPADDRRRAAHRAAHRGALRAAAGHRAHRADRRAVVHHHRAASSACCRSPASPCRSCPTAARRSSRTTCCSRCCCASPTTPATRQEAAAGPR